MVKLRVHIIDDDPDYAEVLAFQVRKTGNVDVLILPSGEAAIEAIDLEPDLIFMDVVMPGMGGLEALRRIRHRRPDIPVAMVSAQSVVSVALEAIGLGAFDYVTKGQDDIVKVTAIARNVGERVKLAREVEALRQQLPLDGFDGMIGSSSQMQSLFRTIKKTLRGDLTVAIVGESGTGKELVAQAIHKNSSRSRAPFVLVNCAAVPRELMESEFFGHEKGSFTGAHARKLGRFEQADGGTIFLDEIGELDLSLQAKLLRVLQDQKVQRIGGDGSIQVDVRVLCATNRDIPTMISAGSFREDLYYRLFQFPVLLPPLRDREQDVLLLAEYFRAEFVKRNRDVEDRQFSAEARRTMISYDWPGNVRELKNAVERALLIADSTTITTDDLMLDRLRLGRESLALQTTSAGRSTTQSTQDTQPSSSPRRIVESAITENDVLPLEELKALAVEHAYRVCGQNINRTAECLGVTRSTIYRLMKKHDVGGSRERNQEDDRNI